MDSLVNEALEFAAERHAGQFRADGVTPYVRHPEMVVAILRRHGVRHSPTLAAAALHDLVEEGRATLVEIRQRFGNVVAWIVDLLSDPPGARADRWRHQLAFIPKAALNVQVVKLGDILANRIDMIQFPPISWDQRAREAYMDHGVAMARALYAAHPPLAQEIITLVQGYVRP